MTDEKVYILEAPINPQNERVNATGKKRDVLPESLLLPVSSLRSSLKLMVFCAFSMRGKVCIHIFLPGTSVDGEVYRQLLSDKLLPTCAEVYPDGDFILQQDGAGAHKAKETQDMLRGLSDRFGIRFIPWKEWPPYSPDANACDYRAWADSIREVYADGTPPSLEVLRERIMRWWDNLSVERVQKWMKELRPRMEKIVAEGRRQIEQYFNKI